MLGFRGHSTERNAARCRVGSRTSQQSDGRSGTARPSRSRDERSVCRGAERRRRRPSHLAKLWTDEVTRIKRLRHQRLPRLSIRVGTRLAGGGRRIPPVLGGCFSSHTRDRLRTRVPIAAMKLAAIGHEDPWVRRKCLSFLDHHAADESVSVFLQALNDPVAPVRDLALHGLACERCRTEALCVAEVTPRIVRVLEDDPDPEVRFKAIPILRRLATRDRTAMSAIERAARADPDECVREAAAGILRGERPRRWNQFRRTLSSRRRGRRD